MTLASGRSPTVILVTDPKWPFARIERAIEAASSALPPGALLVQLRDKVASSMALRTIAQTLRVVTSRVAARFVLNAPEPVALGIAIDVGADGVHVPCAGHAIAEAKRTFGETGWISTPAHTDEDVVTAAREGVTAVLVSPIWQTPGKGPARGTAALVSARARAERVLVYALGGVDGARAASCAEAGADGVAVIRALLDADDPGDAARVLDAPFHSDSGRGRGIAGRG